MARDEAHGFIGRGKPLAYPPKMGRYGKQALSPNHSVGP